jgi:hypothetical protein
MRFLVKRLSSYPYISGDTFRDSSDYIFDEVSNLNPKHVKHGQVVFIKSDLLEVYFEKIHPFIKYKYVILTHNSDAEISDRYIDSKIIRWYAQNVNVKHDIVTPIPIGLENLHHNKNGRVVLFEIYKNLHISKSNTILFGFNVHTNPLERQKALDVLNIHPCAIKIDKWRGPKGYLETLSKHKFVASPEGNGIDCHRTWEAMYLGVIPIVTRSILSEYFYNLGLPILLISNWGEVEDFDMEYLSRFYEEHSDRFLSKYIWADAWLECFSSGIDPLSKINLERLS